MSQLQTTFIVPLEDVSEILTRCVYMNRSNVVTWFTYRTSSSRPEASAVRLGESEYQQPRSASFTSRLPSWQTLSAAPWSSHCY